MIDWIIISLFILSGIGLIILEIIFVPGTTIVGIMGFGLGIYGIYRSYDIFGTSIGHAVLGGSLFLGVVAIVLSFKSNAWKRFSLKGSIDSKVNEKLTVDLEVDQEGLTKSSLKPIGKVEFGEKEYEAKTMGNYVEEKTPVKIIKITGNQIFVEPIN